MYLKISTSSVWWNSVPFWGTNERWSVVSFGRLTVLGCCVGLLELLWKNETTFYKPIENPQQKTGEILNFSPFTFSLSLPWGSNGSCTFSFTEGLATSVVHRSREAVNQLVIESYLEPTGTDFLLANVLCTAIGTERDQKKGGKSMHCVNEQGFVVDNWMGEAYLGFRVFDCLIDWLNFWLIDWIVFEIRVEIDL